jgi:hypothetical protein
MENNFIIEKSLASDNRYHITLNNKVSTSSSLDNLSEKDLLDLADTIIKFLESI